MSGERLEESDSRRELLDPRRRRDATIAHATRGAGAQRDQSDWGHCDIHGDSIRWRSVVAGGDVRSSLGLDLRDRYDERRLLCERCGRQPGVGNVPDHGDRRSRPIAALQSWVENVPIDATLQRQLVSVLKKAEAAAASGDSKTACKQLTTAVSLVNDAGNKLTKGQSNKILNDVARIKSRGGLLVHREKADHPVGTGGPPLSSPFGANPACRSSFDAPSSPMVGVGAMASAGWSIWIF